MHGYKKNIFINNPVKQDIAQQFVIFQNCCEFRLLHEFQITRKRFSRSMIHMPEDARATFTFHVSTCLQYLGIWKLFGIDKIFLMDNDMCVYPNIFNIILCWPPIRMCTPGSIHFCIIGSYLSWNINEKTFNGSSFDSAKPMSSPFSMIVFAVKEFTFIYICHVGYHFAID